MTTITDKRKSKWKKLKTVFGLRGLGLKSRLFQDDKDADSSKQIQVHLGSHTLTLDPHKPRFEIEGLKQHMDDVVARDEELQSLRDKVKRMEDQNRMLQLKEEVLLNLLAAAALDQQMFESALLAVQKRHKQQQQQQKQQELGTSLPQD